MVGIYNTDSIICSQIFLFDVINFFFFLISNCKPSSIKIKKGQPLKYIESIQRKEIEEERKK